MIKKNGCVCVRTIKKVLVKHLSWGYEKSEVFIYALVSIFVIAKAKEIIGGYLLIILRTTEPSKPQYNRSLLVSSRPWLSGLRL